MSEPGARLARELAAARENNPAEFDANRGTIDARIAGLLPRERAEFEGELKRLLKQRDLQAANPTFSQRWNDAAAREIAKRQR
jgi:hypothetical protein